MYQITSNGFYFGLSLNGKELLPCNNNRLWRITEDLVGFRQGKVFGVFSLSSCKVVHEPVLQATIPYFKRAEPDRKNEAAKPHMLSDYGCFEKHMAYLESCDYLFWRNDTLYLLGPEGVAVISRSKGFRAYKGKNPELGANTIKQRCLYEGEYGEPNVGKLREFRYMTRYDERIDEANFLEEFDKEVSDFNLYTGAYEADQEEEEEDDDAELPDYKIYDYDAIPAVIKDKFKKHIDGLTNNKAPEWLIPVLIFMAWCHANKYVTYTQKGEMVIDPFYEMPSEDAAHVINAPGLYAMHDLQHLEHLLYVSPITGTYYDVLALEN